jgi:hypothetical protein
MGHSEGVAGKQIHDRRSIRCVGGIMDRNHGAVPVAQKPRMQQNMINRTSNWLFDGEGKSRRWINRCSRKR